MTERGVTTLGAMKWTTSNEGVKSSVVWHCRLVSVSPRMSQQCVSLVCHCGLGETGP